MAALGKIRSKGAILIGIMGIALFAFVAEEAVRSCDTAQNQRRQRLAEVYGEKINAQDYQQYLEEYTQAAKFEYSYQASMGMNSPEPSDERIRESAWQEFVNNKLILNETEKLGLTVTDQEIQNVINAGTSQFLTTVAIPQFHNPQTGMFDANALKKFLSEYKTARQANPQVAEQLDQAYNYWMFKENQLKTYLLGQKYQGLLVEGVLSNPIEAKLAYNSEKIESDIDLAYIDYKSINDKQVKVTDEDLNKKYKELKERFYVGQELRVAKYIEVTKEASAEDRATLQTKMNEFAKNLSTTTNVEDVVRKSQSSIQYANIPVSKNIFTSDIAGKLDSISVGSVVGPFESKADNTLNIVKLIAKTSAADSIQYRIISVPGNTVDEARAKSDSIYKAIQGGANFEDIAKKYQQTAEKMWITGMQQYQTAVQSKENMPIVEALNSLATNEIRNVELPQGNIIIQVVDKKDVVSKYNVAVIKRNIDFSEQTSQQIYNKFTQFIAGNKDLASIEKNAKKAGYEVKELNGIATSSGNISGITNTREALKWLFEAKEGDVSDVFKCGNNDKLLILALTNIYEKGYLPLSHPQVKDYVKQEALNDKKAETIIEKLKGVNSLAAAKQKGCKTVEVKQITLSSPTVITQIMAQEAALSGAVYATQKGKFSTHPVKGLAGVYLFQVKDRRTLPGAYNANQYMMQIARKNAQSIFQTIQQDLQRQADVIDNRYLFM